MSNSNIESSFRAIDKEFEKYQKRNKFLLENALIKPINEKYYPLAQNGICAMIAPMGAGKTHNYLKLICQQQALHPQLPASSQQPFFELVVICSTSAKFDETVNSFKPLINKSKLVQLKDTKLLPWLNKYQRRILKYNSFIKYLRSNEFNEEMERLGVKHSFTFMKSPKNEPKKYLKNQEKILDYITQKLEKYQWKTYPHRALLIFDDFASHPLLKSRETDLSRLLKKLRHFNINVMICVQTVKSIPKDIKRCLSDIILFPGISKTDFIDLMYETGASALNADVDVDTLWKNYASMYDPHGRYNIYLKAKKIVIDQG